MLRKFVFTVLCTCLAAAAVQAQAYRPSSMVIEAGDWVFTPILDKEQCASPRVHSIVGFVKNALATGDNIRVVWYTRPDTDGTKWKTSTWDTNDYWSAIKSIKTTLAIPDSYDGDWATDGPYVPPAQQVAALEKLYDKGFLAEDPMSTAVVGNEQRELVVETMVSWGYKAADIVFDKDRECNAETLLLAYAKAAEEQEKALCAGDSSEVGNYRMGVAFLQMIQPTTAPTTTIPPTSPPPPLWDPAAPIGTGGLCGVGHKWCSSWFPTAGNVPDCGFSAPTTWISGPNPPGQSTGGGPLSCTYTGPVCRTVKRTCTFLLAGSGWTETSTQCWDYVVVCTPKVADGAAPPGLPAGQTYCPTVPDCANRTNWCWTPLDPALYIH